MAVAVTHQPAAGRGPERIGARRRPVSVPPLTIVPLAPPPCDLRRRQLAATRAYRPAPAARGMLIDRIG